MVEAKLSHASNYPNDLAPRAGSCSAFYMLSDHILVRKKLMGESLIDDGDLGSAFTVLLTERATGEQGDSQGSEVARANHIIRDAWAQPGGRFRLALDIGPPQGVPIP